MANNMGDVPTRSTVADASLHAREAHLSIEMADGILLDHIRGERAEVFYYEDRKLAQGYLEQARSKLQWALVDVQKAIGKLEV